ncbi:hypothetical protein ACSV9I_04475 [Rhizobium sp. G187]|uniref:hypothetical protein n=1 Tax=Rhizobium sp. G187 TaxID=3451352 RepID=UPI003EE49FED
MELKEFIKETIEQILAGISEAQAGSLGENVNASTDGGSATKDLGGHLINRGKFGVFTRIDFDVSVGAESEGKGGLRVAVFGQGVDAGGAHRSSNASRVLFSIPVRLPDGDAERAEGIIAERQKKADERRAARPSGGGSSWMG